MIMFDEAHLRRVLKTYALYYNADVDDVFRTSIRDASGNGLTEGDSCGWNSIGRRGLRSCRYS